MKTAFAFTLAYFLLFAAGVIGYIYNIVDVVHIAFGSYPLTTLFVLRCLGIVCAPLGAALGWF